MDYVSLLYVPKHAPWDLWHSDNPQGVKLYAKRVFIMEDAGSIMPTYLRWVKGVVDISDLPLNMSRETLMADAQISSIKNALSKRIMDGLVKEAKKNDEAYLDFWKEFGKYMKASFEWQGSQKDSFLKLVRFVSTTTDGDQSNRSLKDYVTDMDEAQEKIYYLIGDSIPTLRSSPLLEAYASKGWEVLLLADDFDSWTMQSMTEFEGKTFQDIAIEPIDVEEGSEEKSMDDEEKSFIDQFKKVLDDQVEDVVISSRLSEAVACIVSSRPTVSRGLRGVTNQMARFDLPGDKPKLELNMDHPLMAYMRDVQDEERFAELVRLIFDQAQLASGSVEMDTGPYAQRVNNLIMELLN